jgi:enoyl-CoA hydratase/carnithine racemase
MSALADRINHRALVYLVFSGAEVGGQTAVSLGLASTILDDNDFENESQAIIEAMSKLPLESVRSAKRFLALSQLMEPRGRAELGANLFAIAASSR